MSETLKRFIGSAMPIAAPQRELVVVPPLPPTLDELAAIIRDAHADVEAALLTAAARALDAGLQLKAAKERIRHGGFEDYVASCRLSMRTAQNYMRIARARSRSSPVACRESAGQCAFEHQRAAQVRADVGCEEKAEAQGNLTTAHDPPMRAPGQSVPAPFLLATRVRTRARIVNAID
ncbi:hypothetical protein [Bradyrhizobium diazoefficiens]